MKSTDYRKRVRKNIECPSGLKLEIRKVKAIDYLKLGILPDTLSEMGDNPEKVSPDALDKIQKMFLISIVIPTDEFKIVDKPLNQLEEDEVSYLEIEDEDTNYIISEITAFSFGSEEDKKDIQPFRKEPVSDVA